MLRYAQEGPEMTESTPYNAEYTPQLAPAIPSYTTTPPASPATVVTGGTFPVGRSGQPVAAGLQMKRRDPVAAWLLLPLVTLGIYHLVWYYKIHAEMGQFDRRRAVSPAGPMLVLLFLGWTFIAPCVSYYGCGKRIANTQRAAGLPVTCSPGVGLLLMFCFGLGIFYYQSELNKVVDSYGEATTPGTQIPLYA
jgi:hypothetical protein